MDIQQFSFLLQQSENYLFPIYSDEKGHSNINTALIVLEKDPPALMPALFSYIGTAHNFYSTCQSRYDIDRKIFIMTQNTVLTKTDLQTI